MNLKSLNEAQRRAFLDLIILGVYSDANFAASEDAAIRRVLEDMGVSTVGEQNQQMDASVTRVRKNITSVEAAEKYARMLAETFQEKLQRRQVQDRLSGLLAVDGKVTAAEKKFSSVVDEALRL